jgi:glycosyltransferase involved in cell wall biosynthesis
MFVASDVGGHRELVRHGETGWLFPAGDAAALARAIQDLLGRRDDWDRIRRAAHRFVETERTWNRSAMRYVNLYHSLRDSASRKRVASTV